jgi:leader peptidase (prepilin peptidase)/N-methyltransferase
MTGVLGVLCASLVRFLIAYWDEPGGPACPSCGDVRLLLPPTGRCRRCRVRRGAPAGSVEFASAVVLATLGRPLWLLGLVGVGLAFVDARVHRLPNALTIAFFGLALQAIAGTGRLGVALVGAATAAALYLALAVTGGFGMGDAKLAAGLGLLLGALGGQAVLVGLGAGFALSGLVAVARLATRRARRTSQLPHGPFMLAGALLAVALAAPACPPVCQPIRTVLATLPIVASRHA